MFGLYPRFKPKMAKVFGDAGQVICNGLKDFRKQVKNREFPEPCNCFGISDAQYDELLLLLSEDKEKVNS
jgi:ketopantoate hydroxymethyltransferase